MEKSNAAKANKANRGSRFHTSRTWKHQSFFDDIQRQHGFGIAIDCEYRSDIILVHHLVSILHCASSDSLSFTAEWKKVHLIPGIRIEEVLPSLRLVKAPGVGWYHDILTL